MNTKINTTFVVLLLFLGENIINTADIFVVGSTGARVGAGASITLIFNVITDTKGVTLEGFI